MYGVLILVCPLPLKRLTTNACSGGRATVARFARYKRQIVAGSIPAPLIGDTDVGTI